jgi:Protein phosphatase 2C
LLRNDPEADDVRVQIATQPGSADKPNEDHALACQNLAVIADGLTARTETGCIHGVAWFAEKLTGSVVRFGDGRPVDALRAAIAYTSSLHADTCDLSHPATPCAAVAIVQIGGDGLARYLVLGDVSIVLAGEEIKRVVSDQRISETALAQRAEADDLRYGSHADEAALVRMKELEIAARNRPDGYWIAGADPKAVDHALIGEIPLCELTRIALFTDGAARAVDLFRMADWRDVLDLLGERGPRELITRVRAVESADGDVTRWPRNKVSDDATAVYCDELDEHECASR